MNIKLLILICLILVSCGSAGGKDFSIKIYAVDIDCRFAEQVMLGVIDNFQQAGITLITDLNCVEWGKSYEFGETKKALSDLSAQFGRGHYLLPKFGDYFDGYQSGNSSLSVAVEGRLLDSLEQASHEIAHQFGATHDFSNCNIMSLRRCGYPAKFNNKAILEMK